MRLIRILLQGLSLLSIAFASVIPDPACDASCPCSALATAIVNNFLSLLTNFNVAAANALTADFIDTSDSIDYLTGIPLGSPTSHPRPAFELSQDAQHRTPISLINIDAVTCEGTIAFRWVAYPGTGEMEVKGISVLHTTNSGDKHKVGPGGWQISHVFSEFNTAAWIVNLGLPCNPPLPKAV
ncbi:hypothetical protein C8A00DRAFT_18203 [Chaetomidium leptoderma]|uniref:NTF2-like domain-containing protein n=1 Tax=Chaetomidium leptoderma TaxID=669021 RepID=A0AAN6VG77_9PEZI|nr:hypothetical protein C8A00DRAFT_18203 [Chaetomidium leptoderma]